MADDTLDFEPEALEFSDANFDLSIELRGLFWR